MDGIAETSPETQDFSVLSRESQSDESLWSPPPLSSSVLTPQSQSPSLLTPQSQSPSTLIGYISSPSSRNWLTVNFSINADSLFHYIINRFGICIDCSVENAESSYKNSEVILDNSSGTAESIIKYPFSNLRYPTSCFTEWPH
ncbi:hypothetical protein ABEB36_009357 [Hypothenemus hampei]|uniref:Uncharacterized protein n=1 Tax=Hypothenemus hampei TaxID=57062 RepID=A0ABD1EG39_HYPHA